MLNNLFFTKSTNLSFVQLLKDFGSWPTNAFDRKYNASSWDKNLKEEGISPDKVLFDKLRTTNLFWNFNQQSGSLPDNKLLERSNKVNSSSIWHKKERFPKNLFLDRFIDDNLEGSNGMLPSSWL